MQEEVRFSEKFIPKPVSVGLGCLQVFFWLFMMFVIWFASIDWEKDYDECIPQKVGGVLICKGHESSDLHSWDVLVGYYYKKGNDSARKIGSGWFQGVNWKPKDQLVNIGDWYYLVTGDGYKGQMLLYGKLSDTTEWKEFYLTPDSVMIDSNWIKLNKYNLELVGKSNFNYYTWLLIRCFNPSKKTMFVKGSAYRFTKRIEIELFYSFDPSTGKPELINLKYKAAS